jgi:hypothetical protein
LHEKKGRKYILDLRLKEDFRKKTFSTSLHEELRIERHPRDLSMKKESEDILDVCMNGESKHILIDPDRCLIDVGSLHEELRIERHVAERSR